MYLSGIIPAYAGSTYVNSVYPALAADHPRIRGEHVTTFSAIDSPPGSSPHTRGALENEPSAMARFRIIPAYAGSTRRPLWHGLSSRDHPRIRGEHLRRPPRVGCAVGSSPHTRGARLREAVDGFDGRIIPAYAGSTSSSHTFVPHSADHPRIRGEHSLTSLVMRSCCWIIPAYAGSTSGLAAIGNRAAGSSPHTRGARRTLPSCSGWLRIIPAYAGSTPLGTRP